MWIDLHADTPLWQAKLGYDFCRAHRAPLPAGAWFGNLDLPRMARASLDAQIFGLVALPWEGDGMPVVLRQIRRLEEAAARRPDALALVRTGAELRLARAAGRRCGLLSVEGAHCLRGSLARADALIARGVVSMGLVHFHRNAAATPARGLGRDDARGLTDFGRRLVAHLAARRIVVDLAHINRAGFDDALRASAGPVMVSHTGVAGVHPHWRNLGDDQIRAVADRGGIVGVIFSRHFLGGGDLDAVVRHVRHLIAVGGVACAALGSDFDGFVVPVRGLRDITGLPALAEALGRAGLSPATVAAVMGDNALAFLTRSLGPA